MRKTRKKHNKHKKKNKIIKYLRKYSKKNNKYKLTIGGDLKDITIFSQKYTQYFKKISKNEPILQPISKEYITIPIDELITLSTNIITEIVDSSTYSLVPYYFLGNDIDIMVQDEIVSKQNSGNCVSFSHMVLDKLHKHGISGVIIPATLPPRLIQSGYPLYGHVATLLQTHSHFIIFEPAYFILEPIIINKNGDNTDIRVNVFNAIWTFSYDEKLMQINVKMDEKPLFYYKVCVIENPSESVSYPINILNKRIPTVKYDCKSNRKIAHFAIRVDTQSLEGYNINNTHEDHWYNRFEWKSCFENERMTIQEKIRILSDWEGFSETQCRDLGYNNRNELIEKVYSIISIEWENNKNASLFGGATYKYEKSNWIL
jgi:hypothetical protein